MSKKTTYIIFLVEDDQVFAKTLELHLKEHLKYNVEIHHFSSGEECLHNLNLKPHIIVLDYFLNSQNPSAQNGLEILKKVKKADPEAEVVMLSVQDKIEVAVNAMTHGAFYYLTKNEVAFLRLESIIFNIIKLLKLKQELKSVKKGKVWVFVAIVVVAIIASIVYYYYPNV